MGKWAAWLGGVAGVSGLEADVVAGNSDKKVSVGGTRLSLHSLLRAARELRMLCDRNWRNLPA